MAKCIITDKEYETFYLVTFRSCILVILCIQSKKRTHCTVDYKKVFERRDIYLLNCVLDCSDNNLVQ